MNPAAKDEARSRIVKQRAAELGFDACGIAEMSPIDPEDRLGAWLAHGYHADMNWIAQSKDIRQDPRLKLPLAQSVVVVACNYYSARPAPAPGTGRVSRYAWNRDYHLVLRKPMAELSKTIAQMKENAECYVSVDAGPVQERAWAARAGVGWIGKNGLIIREGLGSWLFLGVIVTTLELAPDAPVPSKCGACNKCIEACPTAAIVEPGIIDARRCISYHKAENKNGVPDRLKPLFGNRVFGCDACQEACPWNRDAPETRVADFLPRPECANPDLDACLNMDEAEFDKHFAGSPIRRAKYEAFRRNLLIAKANLER